MLASPISLPLSPPAAANAAESGNLSVSRCAQGTGKMVPYKAGGNLVKSHSARPFTAEKVSVSLDTRLPMPKPSFHRDDEAHPDLRKTRMCPNYTSASRCPLTSDKCKFAHSNDELRVSYDRYYKVQPCAFFDRGKCRNGDFCRFAHGPHELRVASPGLSSAPSPPPAATTGSAFSVQSKESPLIGVPQSSIERSKMNKTFDLASFLSTQQQRHKRQSLVSFVGSKHSRRRSDATGGHSSGSETVSGGREDELSAKADFATCSGGSPDGSPLGGRSTGFSSNDAWSDWSPLTLLSSEASPARLSVHSATSSQSNIPSATWEKRPFPVANPPSAAVAAISCSMSAAIRLSLTSEYRD
eukprot:Gregarina_sp_Poly_1__7120@NODE_38_length_18185_cov_164_455735_g33_i0_p4_GENE_NODE_38_length_18185_cov_164_455735_g33_i0NODE_38_length_18185_cov_164_455735_g33_i0_p4_ORF_typecomplete_len356_score33_59zfCCCH/PF00642_24/0_014zfCCCH/PF00642_24/6e08zfCCCH_3/PF15663_5/1_6zfCCCH_3/PF15663_5/0_0068zfCCCH_4/PF18044_1/6_3e03zfCCCH_4/PF18044_1/35zfCCCH_4/PF18044_1/0_00079Torus/PF16131_5/0_0044zf_CCCH_4/PF18345_1/15zf_CCCH_4/PF18345_1/0_0079zfCCCH_2/PF14608_6/28zfCCCH_2/PF14608_6/6_9_NODE_38_length_18185_co